MDQLPVAVIGWVLTIGCGIALAAGTWMIIGLHYSGPEAKKHLASRVLDDIILFAIWILGFAGGIGLLLGTAWSSMIVQLFCWTLIALVVLSSWQRWRSATPPKRTLAISLVLFAGPLLVFCVASIMALRAAAGVGGSAG